MGKDKVVSEMKERISEETGHKTPGELKDQLKDVEDLIRKGRMIKKRTQKEIGKKTNFQDRSTTREKGLGGIIDYKEKAIHISSDLSNQSSGLDRDELNILNPVDSGTPIDDIKGLDDILDD